MNSNTKELAFSIEFPLYSLPLVTVRKVEETFDGKKSIDNIVTITDDWRDTISVKTDSTRFPTALDALEYVKSIIDEEIKEVFGEEK
jgi:hypothetical protein